jgi:hypothetical protein
MKRVTDFLVASLTPLLLLTLPLIALYTLIRLNEPSEEAAAFRLEVRTFYGEHLAEPVMTIERLRFGDGSEQDRYEFIKACDSLAETFDRVSPKYPRVRATGRIAH